MNKLISLRRLLPTAVILTAPCILRHLALGQGLGTGTPVCLLPAVYADPAVPLLQLPTNFRARRTSTSVTVNKDQSVDIFDVEGAGCVRHSWFAFGSQFNLTDVEIEITVDGAAEPQARMPLRSFFGVLPGFADYHMIGSNCNF